MIIVMMFGGASLGYLSYDLKVAVLSDSSRWPDVFGIVHGTPLLPDAPVVSRCRRIAGGFLSFLPVLGYISLLYDVTDASRAPTYGSFLLVFIHPYLNARAHLGDEVNEGGLGTKPTRRVLGRDHS